jgi:hypothetical protein
MKCDQCGQIINSEEIICTEQCVNSLGEHVADYYHCSESCRDASVARHEYEHSKNGRICAMGNVNCSTMKIKVEECREKYERVKSFKKKLIY